MSTRPRQEADLRCVGMVGQCLLPEKHRVLPCRPRLWAIVYGSFGLGNLASYLDYRHKPSARAIRECVGT